MASADRDEADSVACFIACGYAWKIGGGSQVGDVRVESGGEGFVDFVLDLFVLEPVLAAFFFGGLLSVLLSFAGFELSFIRDILAVRVDVVDSDSEMPVAVRCI